MRISTNQIYDAGSQGIQQGQSSLYKLQNQLSTGRRVLTPQDDPVAASQVLIKTQSMEVNAQYIDNQGQAKHQLGLVDTQMTSLINALQNVRDRVVQAGNTTLNRSDRESIATELESRLSEIMGIANSDNGTGDYLFSGYSGRVLPFSVDATQAAISPATTSPIGYYGDAGQRQLQVSASRQMAVNVSGVELFQSIRNGNGTFVTGTGGNLATITPYVPPAPPAPAVQPTFNATATGKNQGTATVDEGSVMDLGLWNATVNPKSFMVRFAVTTIGGVSTTTYCLYDNTNPAAPVDLSGEQLPYTPGQSIPLQKSALVPIAAPTAAQDFGAKMVISGKPADGDSFTVKPSTSQSLFQTMQNLVGILRSPVGSTTYTTTQYSNELSAELTNVDQALDNVSRMQSIVGTRLQEIDSLGFAASDLAIQYKSDLSDLQDVDYAAAISDFIKQQTNLEAAQKSFSQVSGLSLFKYI